MNNVVRDRRYGHAARKRLLGAASTLLICGTIITDARATEPCGDFGECKVLVEINSTDGDIGFHWLIDGDGQRATRMRDPDGRKIWQDNTGGALREQKKTENFGESSEPLCWEDPEADEDEEIVTLEDFIERWAAGTYTMRGRGDGERLSGATELTYYLPAAPQDVDFDGSVVSWTPGDDLGNCASSAELAGLVAAGILPEHPQNVTVRAWEIVVEPDVEDGNPVAKFTFRVRVPGNIAPTEATVSADYLASLPDNTPVKIEAGAIGGDFDVPDGVGDDDNATFTEVDGFCVNEVDDGCEDEEEE